MRALLPKGISLIETVLYIGLIGILLPSFIVFVQYVWQEQIRFDARMRLEQVTSILFLETTSALTEAEAISISASTLGTDASSLVFQDANNATVTIDLANTSVAFTDTTQPVRRLRLQRGSAPAVWLTEPEQDVTQWRVDPVRNASGVLTGLRISFAAELLNGTKGVYRNATLSTNTTISLSPQTLEQ